MTIGSLTDVEVLAKLFRGLSDPSRLGIVQTLTSGERSVSQIVAATGLSQPNVSGHLSCLRDCGLVTSRPHGRLVFYALADERMEDLLLAAGDILCRVSGRLCACGRYEC